MAICSHLNQCCSCPGSAPSSFAAALALPDAMAWGRDQQRPRGLDECWSAGAGIPVRAVSPQQRQLSSDPLGELCWGCPPESDSLVCRSLLQISHKTRIKMKDFFIHSQTPSQPTKLRPGHLHRLLQRHRQGRWLDSAEYLSETLGLITALATAAASVLQWNRVTQTGRWRNSNRTWKKHTRKQQQQQNPLSQQCEKPLTHETLRSPLRSAVFVKRECLHQWAQVTRRGWLLSPIPALHSLINWNIITGGVLLCVIAVQAKCYAAPGASSWQLLFQESILEAKF